MRRIVYTHSAVTRTFSGAHPHIFMRVNTHTWLKDMKKVCCIAHVASLHLAMSMLMFHPPCLLFPGGHFETFPTSTSASSLSSTTRLQIAGQAHFRTSGEEFVKMADSAHSTPLTIKFRPILYRTLEYCHSEKQKIRQHNLVQNR